ELLGNGGHPRGVGVVVAVVAVGGRALRHHPEGVERLGRGGDRRRGEHGCRGRHRRRRRGNRGRRQRLVGGRDRAPTATAGGERLGCIVLLRLGRRRRLLARELEVVGPRRRAVHRLRRRRRAGGGELRGSAPVQRKDGERSPQGAVVRRRLCILRVLLLARTAHDEGPEQAQDRQPADAVEAHLLSFDEPRLHLGEID